MSDPARPSSRPLVVTSDPLLLDEVLRVAGAAGVQVNVVTELALATRGWAAAPLVVVGADAARRTTGTARAPRLPRRADVVLLGDDLDDPGVWQLAVVLGAEHVVFLPDAEQWLGDRLADAVEDASGVAEAPVVAVIGGQGGAGASVLAAGLALAAVRRGTSALLVDADPFGGGADLVLGGDDAPGLRWAELRSTDGRLPASSLAAALPVVAGVSVLTWDRAESPQAPPVAPEAMESVVSAGRRGHGLVVVDLPRRLDATAQAAVVIATTTLIVVPLEVRATVSAARVAMACVLCRDLRLVGLGDGSGLAGAQVARALGLPLAGEMRRDRHVALDLERGDPPGRKGGALVGLCDRLVDELLTGTAFGRAA